MLLLDRRVSLGAEALWPRAGDPRDDHVAAALEQCEAETTVEESYRGYRFNRGDLPVSLACAALRRAGVEPQLGLTGGADANVFNERGKACVNLANGMMEIHTPDEHIAVADLERMVEVTFALVDVAGRRGRGRLTSATDPRPVASFQDAACHSALGAARSPASAGEHDDLTRLEVDGQPAIAYPRLTGPVGAG